MEPIAKEFLRDRPYLLVKYVPSIEEEVAVIVNNVVAWPLGSFQMALPKAI